MRLTLTSIHQLDEVHEGKCELRRHIVAVIQTCIGNFVQPLIDSFLVWFDSIINRQ
jgi:hypothetical protein